MFSRNKNDKSNAGSDAKPQPKAKPAPPSIVSIDLEMDGNLSSTGEIHVDGTIIGDIHTYSLLVGPTADIKGEIIADQVRIHGRVKGQIRARQVTLAKTAHVVGDILHEDLSIETGAFLEGLCKHETVVVDDNGGDINLVKDSPNDTPKPKKASAASGNGKETGSATETPVVAGEAKEAVG